MELIHLVGGDGHFLALGQFGNRLHGDGTGDGNVAQGGGDGGLTHIHSFQSRADAAHILRRYPHDILVSAGPFHSLADGEGRVQDREQALPLAILAQGNLRLGDIQGLAGPSGADAQLAVQFVVSLQVQLVGTRLQNIDIEVVVSAPVFAVVRIVVGIHIPQLGVIFFIGTNQNIGALGFHGEAVVGRLQVGHGDIDQLTHIQCGDLIDMHRQCGAGAGGCGDGNGGSAYGQILQRNAVLVHGFHGHHIGIAGFHGQHFAGSKLRIDPGKDLAALAHIAGNGILLKAHLGDALGAVDIHASAVRPLVHVVEVQDVLGTGGQGQRAAHIPGRPVIIQITGHIHAVFIDMEHHHAPIVAIQGKDIGAVLFGNKAVGLAAAPGFQIHIVGAFGNGLGSADGDIADRAGIAADGGNGGGAHAHSPDIAVLVNGDDGFITHDPGDLGGVGIGRIDIGCQIADATLFHINIVVVQLDALRRNLGQQGKPLPVAFCVTIVTVVDGNLIGHALFQLEQVTFSGLVLVITDIIRARHRFTVGSGDGGLPGIVPGGQAVQTGLAGGEQIGLHLADVDEQAVVALFQGRIIADSDLHGGGQAAFVINRQDRAAGAPAVEIHCVTPPAQDLHDLAIGGLPAHNSVHRSDGSLLHTDAAVAAGGIHALIGDQGHAFGSGGPGQGDVPGGGLGIHAVVEQRQVVGFAAGQLHPVSHTVAAAVEGIAGLVAVAIGNRQIEDVLVLAVVQHIPAVFVGREGVDDLIAGRQGHFPAVAHGQSLRNLRIDPVSGGQAAGSGHSDVREAAGYQIDRCFIIADRNHHAHIVVADGPGQTVRCGSAGLHIGIQGQIGAHITGVALWRNNIDGFCAAGLGDGYGPGFGIIIIVVQVQDAGLTGGHRHGIGFAAVFIPPGPIHCLMIRARQRNSQEALSSGHGQNVSTVSRGGERICLVAPGIQPHRILTQLQSGGHGDHHGDGYFVALLGAYRQGGLTGAHGADRRIHGEASGFLNGEDLLVAGFPGQIVHLGGHGLQMGVDLIFATDHQFQSFPIQGDAGGLIGQGQRKGQIAVGMGKGGVTVPHAGFQGGGPHISLVHIVMLLHGIGTVQRLHTLDVGSAVGIGQRIVAGDFRTEIEEGLAAVGNKAGIYTQGQRIAGFDIDGHKGFDAQIVVVDPDCGGTGAIQAQFRHTAVVPAAAAHNAVVTALPVQISAVNIGFRQNESVEIHNVFLFTGYFRLAQPDAGGIGGLGKDKALGIGFSGPVIHMNDGLNIGIQPEPETDAAGGIIIFVDPVSILIHADIPSMLGQIREIDHIVAGLGGREEIVLRFTVHHGQSVLTVSKLLILLCLDGDGLGNRLSGKMCGGNGHMTGAQADKIQIQTLAVHSDLGHRFIVGDGGVFGSEIQNILIVNPGFDAAAQSAGNTVVRIVDPIQRLRQHHGHGLVGRLTVILQTQVNGLAGSQVICYAVVPIDHLGDRTGQAARFIQALERPVVVVPGQVHNIRACFFRGEGIAAGFPVFQVQRIITHGHNHRLEYLDADAGGGTGIGIGNGDRTTALSDEAQPACQSFHCLHRGNIGIISSPDQIGSGGSTGIGKYRNIRGGTYHAGQIFVPVGIQIIRGSGLRRNNRMAILGSAPVQGDDIGLSGFQIHHIAGPVAAVAVSADINAVTVQNGSGHLDGFPVIIVDHIGAVFLGHEDKFLCRALFQLHIGVTQVQRGPVLDVDAEFLIFDGRFICPECEAVSNTGFQVIDLIAILILGYQAVSGVEITLAVSAVHQEIIGAGGVRGKADDGFKAVFRGDIVGGVQLSDIVSGNHFQQRIPRDLFVAGGIGNDAAVVSAVVLIFRGQFQHRCIGTGDIGPGAAVVSADLPLIGHIGALDQHGHGKGGAALGLRGHGIDQDHQSGQGIPVNGTAVKVSDLRGPGFVVRGIVDGHDVLKAAFRVRSIAGEHQALELPAAAEGIDIQPGHMLGHLESFPASGDRQQGGAVCAVKHTVHTDKAFAAGRHIDVLQIVAVIEGIAVEIVHRRGQRDIFQAGIVECPIGQPFQALGQFNGSQAGAAAECLDIDIFEGSGQNHFLQGSTVLECRLGQFGNPFADDRPAQVFTVIEHIGSHFRHGIGNDDFFQAAAAAEGAVADGRQALGQNNLRHVTLNGMVADLLQGGRQTDALCIQVRHQTVADAGDALFHHNMADSVITEVPGMVLITVVIRGGSGTGNGQGIGAQIQLPEGSLVQSAGLRPALAADLADVVGIVVPDGTGFGIAVTAVDTFINGVTFLGAVGTLAVHDGIIVGSGNLQRPCGGAGITGILRHAGNGTGGLPGDIVAGIGMDHGYLETAGFVPVSIPEAQNIGLAGGHFHTVVAVDIFNVAAGPQQIHGRIINAAGHAGIRGCPALVSTGDFRRKGEIRRAAFRQLHRRPCAHGQHGMGFLFQNIFRFRRGFRDGVTGNRRGTLHLSRKGLGGAQADQHGNGQHQGQDSSHVHNSYLAVH